MSHPFNLSVEGNGDPLLFVNGLYNGASAWTPYTRELRERYRVVSFDFPTLGFGAEQWCGFREQQDVILAALAEAGVLAEQTVAIGVSGGANLLRCLHTERSVSFRGIVMLAPNPGGLTQFFKQLHDSYLVLLDRHGVEAFWRASLHTFYAPAFFNANRGIYELLVETLSDNFDGDPQRIAQLIRGLFEDTTLEHPAATFDSPLMVLQGEQDVLIPKQDMDAYVAKCSAPVLDYRYVRGGHGFPFERSAEVLAAIGQFIAGLSPLSAPRAAPALAART